MDKSERRQSWTPWLPAAWICWRWPWLRAGIMPVGVFLLGFAGLSAALAADRSIPRVPAGPVANAANTPLRGPYTLPLQLGDVHSCVLLASGEIACWGGNSKGQVGDGTSARAGDTEDSADRMHPVRVLAVHDATQVALGGEHSCARLSRGGAACWGVNEEWQLGGAEPPGSVDVVLLDRPGTASVRVGKPSQSEAPVTVATLADVSVVAAGNAHSCALRQGGGVFCWGYNDNGQLGRGDLEPGPHGPFAAVVGLSKVTKLSTRGYHTCALKTSGIVLCWGRNARGELGDGTTVTRPSPVRVVGLTRVVQVAAGEDHTCARRADGSVLCWGDNEHGQLGNGTMKSSSKPVRTSSIRDAVEVVAGNEFSCARKRTGEVACWGTMTPLGEAVLRPVRVVGLTNAVSIAAGGWHACAKRTGEQVACWGWNRHGQLGDGTQTDRSVATSVSGLQ